MNWRPTRCVLLVLVVGNEVTLRIIYVNLIQDSCSWRSSPSTSIHFHTHIFSVSSYLFFSFHFCFRTVFFFSCSSAFFGNGKMLSKQICMHKLSAPLPRTVYLMFGHRQRFFHWFTPAREFQWICEPKWRKNERIITQQIYARKSKGMSIEYFCFCSAEVRIKLMMTTKIAERKKAKMCVENECYRNECTKFEIRKSRQGDENENENSSSVEKNHWRKWIRREQGDKTNDIRSVVFISFLFLFSDQKNSQMALAKRWPDILIHLICRSNKSFWIQQQKARPFWL